MSTTTIPTYYVHRTQRHRPLHNNSNKHMVLKVVGASWLKTRISSMIIGSVVLLGFGSIYFTFMERLPPSGNYCATVYYTERNGFRTEFWGQRHNLSVVPAGVARTCYSDSTLTTGWSQIEIETHPAYQDADQAFAAGLLEGSLTFSTVQNHWSNTVQSHCTSDNATAAFCDWLRSFVEHNRQTVIDQAERLSATHDDWHQIRLYYHQMHGLISGMRMGAERARAPELEMDDVDLLVLNAAADMADMRVFYEHYVRDAAAATEYVDQPTRASMLLRLLGAGRPRLALFGHSSDGSYASMLRMLKRYKFHFHRTSAPDAHEVCGTSVEFTGYPGVLSSNDDFYMVSGRRSRLTIGGVRMRNANVELWRQVDAPRSVPLGARVMAANRLAPNGYRWSWWMAGHAGFGTKQWMIVDVARLHSAGTNDTRRYEMVSRIRSTDAGTMESSQSAPVIDRMDAGEDRDDAAADADDGQRQLVWVVDQLPGRLHAEDVTERILQPDGDADGEAGGAGVWFGNGVPYFGETLQDSRGGRDETRSRTNRLLARTSIDSLDDVARVLRSSAYRGDLMDNNGGAEDDARAAHGNIDMKLYAESSDSRVDFRAIAGPLFFRHALANETTAAPTATESVDRSAMPMTNEQMANAEDEIDPARLQEIDMSAERRPVRNDVRATALMRQQHGPFRWSQSDLAVEHAGHPDEFDFEPVSPKWAW